MTKLIFLCYLLGSALVQSPENLALSLSEVTAQLAHVLSPANQRPSCLSTIYPGGRCHCDDIPGEETCAQTPGMDDKTPVCLGPAHLLPGRPCLVYSVGMNPGLTFENEMAKFGCTVHAFDPVRHVNRSDLPPGMHAHSIGVGDVSQIVSVGGHQLVMKTLDDLVNHMRHEDRQVDYLKMTGSGEWSVLRQQLDGDSGATLRKIPQLAVTLHLRYPHGIFQRGVEKGELPSLEDTREFLQLVRSLEAAGFQLTWSRPGKQKFGGTNLSHEYHTFWVQKWR